MKIVKAGQMAEIDRRSIEEYGFPGLLLMENAGIRMFEAFLAGSDMVTEKSALVFVAGGGNNGGDALVMARQAHSAGFKEVSIVSAAERWGEAAALHLNICSGLHIPIHPWEPAGQSNAAGAVLLEADFIFDGITGTGCKGALSGTARDVVEFLNLCRGRKIALDVPSGIGDAFKAGFPSTIAHRTLTVGLPKMSLYLPDARPRCGEIEVVSIGFPSELLESKDIRSELLTIYDLPPLLPAVPAGAYKNTRGSLCVFAGSEGTAGAAALAAETAARSRAGLVTLMIERDLYHALAGSMKSVITRPWDPGGSPADFDFSRYGALCVGPGWGFENREPWLGSCVASKLPGVLDADGLSLLSGMNRPLDFGGRWVLTPHPGEFCRITGMRKEYLFRNPYDAVLQASDHWNAVVVLKSHVTYIAEPGGRIFVADGMNPALGTGGSGDVLTGLTGGLLAHGLSPIDAACAAVLIHGEAGKRCFTERGWFASEDLVPFVSRIVTGRDI